MLFGPNLRPERQKLLLIQLISQDTPSTPCEDGQRFCVLLRYEPEGSEPQQLLQEQEADQAMAQLGLSGISVGYRGRIGGAGAVAGGSECHSNAPFPHRRALCLCGIPGDSG